MGFISLCSEAEVSGCRNSQHRIAIKFVHKTISYRFSQNLLNFVTYEPS
jgi:hypothetical protein